MFFFFLMSKDWDVFFNDQECWQRVGGAATSSVPTDRSCHDVYPDHISINSRSVIWSSST